MLGLDRITFNPCIMAGQAAIRHLNLNINNGAIFVVRASCSLLIPNLNALQLISRF
jgi:hypothetical protein